MNDQIVYEIDQERYFLAEIAALPEGERVRSCLQCGTCSASCPIAPLMEHTPRRIFAMIRIGMKHEVLSSPTIWMCASCYECTVKCPAQIKITEIMYALKRKAIHKGIKTSNCDVDRFYKLFTSIVCKYGRNHEMLLLMKYMMFHHPYAMTSQLPTGLRLFSAGCMPIRPHKLKNHESFNRIVRKALDLDKRVKR